MAGSTNTFWRFVDVLASTLDDQEATGVALAARAGLSRYHFDRVVAAVAGEPPSAFRRRILLERAAYRLATTHETVLSIAMDAGYSSHEAFTRAFRRAFGRTPSTWRRSPSRFQLDAPSQVHFHPPGSLRVPARRKVTPMDLLIRMIEHNIWLVGEMLGRAESLTDDVLDAPIELSVEDLDDEPTLRSQLARLVGQLEMWNAAISGQDYDFTSEEGQSVTCLRRRLTECGPTFVENVRTIVREDRLDEIFLNAVCAPPDAFTYGGMIAHVLTFAAHRRTLVCGALIDAGVTDLGAGDPKYWVGEAA